MYQVSCFYHKVHDSSQNCYISAPLSLLAKLTTLSTQPLIHFSLHQYLKCILRGINGPRRDKTCLRGFRQSDTQTSPLNHRDYLEDCKFTFGKFTYDPIQNVNNKGADQTARMRRLVCACAIRKPPKTGFLASRALIILINVKVRTRL